MNGRRFMLALLTATALSGVALSAQAQQIQISKDNKTIAITASGEAEALADTAVLTVGFQLFGKDQDITYAEASRTSNAIMSALTGAGVPKDSIQSTTQSLTPLEPFNDANKTRYAQGIRFQFSQSWQVTVPAAQAAAVLHSAITAGANDSGNIQWQLHNDDALQSDAAGNALAHARQIAARMAAGLGVKLGPLVYASNQAPERPIFGLAGMASDRYTVPEKNLAPLAISPEKITRSATVYAVFALE
jgi:uncharacterized protein YggE